MISACVDAQHSVEVPWMLLRMVGWNPGLEGL